VIFETFAPGALELVAAPCGPPVPTIFASTPKCPRLEQVAGDLLVVLLVGTLVGAPAQYLVRAGALVVVSFDS
jgi:hypothetical protein